MTKNEKNIALFGVIALVTIDFSVRQYFNVQRDKRAERTALKEEIGEYMACKGDLVCQRLYPNAERAVKKAQEELDALKKEH